ncbi:DNA methyltransferase [Aureimonas mangrovi]|uniref:DNA methyltransferase n=1 Tax=Aureimonas mangrovi TaxID=2758041 RepID=UPI00163D4E38|nr:DNA methyltransferase [Aureimonas mangrovi]
MHTFTHGTTTLYLDDCRDVLPTLPAGAVYLTDPVWPNVPAGLIPGSDRPDDLFAETMFALIDPRRLVVVMRTDSDPRMLRHVPEGLPFIRQIDMPYAIPSPVGRVMIGNDVAYVYGEHPYWQRNRKLMAGRAIAAQPSAKRVGHPCPRPLKHAEWLVERLTDACDLVVDPFVGSGTMAIAAHRAGRRFVGIEIDPTFFEIACERLVRETRQGQLFNDTATAAFAA